MLHFKRILSSFKLTYHLQKKKFSIKDNCDASLLVECLNNRALLRLSGKDASMYLQGLVTNDMRHLESGALSMYALFLNSKGRVLFDSIIYKVENEQAYLIECDAAAASSLYDLLIHYKVRRKINVDSVKEKYTIWSVVDQKQFQKTDTSFDYKKTLNSLLNAIPNAIITIDPRLSHLGLRIMIPIELNIRNEIAKANINSREDSFYKLMRYRLGVGEGIEELPCEKCFPMEVNGDYMHGISFHKGCYIGQELTARTYHTGAIRKRIMPLVFTEKVEVNEHGIPIYTNTESNKSIGKLYGVEKLCGMGLLRIEEALKADELKVLNFKCTTHRPFWWPNEAPKTRTKIF